MMKMKMGVVVLWWWKRLKTKWKI